MTSMSTVSTPLTQKDYKSKIESPSKQKDYKPKIESPSKQKVRHCQKALDKMLQDSLDQGLKVFKLDQCISSLQKEPCYRSTNDLLAIKSFLETTELAKKFSSDNIPEDSLQKILLMCSTEMLYLEYPKSKILFRIGDEGTHFYIILKGRIEILKVLTYEQKLSSFEYFDHIMTLYNTDEIFILKKTIEANQGIISIDYNDMPMLKKIILSVLLDDFYSNSSVQPADIIGLIESCHVDIAKDQLNIYSDRLDDVNYFISIKNLLNNYIGKIPQKKIEHYRGLKHKNLRNKYALFKYQSFLELKDGAFFGDMAIDKKTTRSATIKTIDETHFCYLDIQSYSRFLLAEKKRLTLNEVAFLVNNFFFKTISFFVFERNYLGFFIYQEYYKNDVLFKEQTRADYIYFIRDGQIELSMKKNIFEIHNLYTYLSNLGTKEGDKEEERRLPFCKNDFENLKDHLKKVIDHGLLITNGKECLGQESLYFGLNYLYTARVRTKKCKIYKIDARSLIKLFQAESMSYNWFVFNCKNKINVLKDRLGSIQESQIRYVDHSIRNDKTNLANLFSNDINENSLSLTDKLNKRTKRVLKSRINQVKPLSFNLTHSLNLNNTIQMLPMVETNVINKKLESTKKPYETFITNMDTLATPDSKTKRKDNTINSNNKDLRNNNCYNLLTVSTTKVNANSSLLIETILLNKIKKKLASDPMITNNNFINIANRKAQSRLQEKKIDDLNSKFYYKQLKSEQKRTMKKIPIANSRNGLFTERVTSTLEDNKNTNSDVNITLTHVKNSSSAKDPNSNINTNTNYNTNNNDLNNNTSVLNSKLFSGKYFKKKRQQYLQYKEKRSNYSHISDNKNLY